MVPDLGTDRIRADLGNFDLKYKLTAQDEESSPFVNAGHNCSYFTPGEFQAKYAKSTKHFSTLSLNVRSLPGKWDEFKDLMTALQTKDSFKFSVIGIQEVWNVPRDTNFDLDGYSKFEYRVRDQSGLNHNAGGGVGFWVDEKFDYEIINKLSIFVPHVFESLFIKVKFGKNKHKIIGNIYRPNTGPNSDVHFFLKSISEIFTMISNDDSLSRCQVDLTGDMNLDLLKFDQHNLTAQFLESLLSHGHLPLITVPTRVQHNAATLIDNITTTLRSDSYEAGVILADVSDHFPTFFFQTIGSSYVRKQKVMSRKINDVTSDTFCNVLNATNWHSVTSENRPKFAFDNFLGTIDAAVELSFPLVNVKPNDKYISFSPWMTKGLLTSRRQKEKLFALKIKNPVTQNVNRFKSYNNLYNSVKRKHKMLYYEQKFQEYSSNMKESWGLIREVISRKKHRANIPDYLKVNGLAISNALDMANSFNEFFVNIGPELANKIPQDNGDFRSYLGAPVDENFVFPRVTIDHIFEMTKSLKTKTSSGIDCISSKLLKLMIPIIAIPLCHVLNLSLQTGFIPLQFKTAKVIPIFKSGATCEVTNYRPISLLPTFMKLFEKIVAKFVYKFLDKKCIFYKHQYGFRKRHNTSYPVISFLDKIYNNLNKSNPQPTLAIFVDLKKAFDTVDHKILLEKLKNYGFRGLSSLWFKNYLSDRTQYVVIDGQKSKPGVITCGVPQGLVLGPLLFLLYINDLHGSSNLFMLLFADDTTFQIAGNNLTETYSLANSELKKVAKWFRENKLM